MPGLDHDNSKLPWDDNTGDLGTTILFLTVAILIVVVGVLLFVGTGTLFPGHT